MKLQEVSEHIKRLKMLHDVSGYTSTYTIYDMDNEMLLLTAGVGEVPREIKYEWPEEKVTSGNYGIRIYTKKDDDIEIEEYYD